MRDSKAELSEYWTADSSVLALFLSLIRPQQVNIPALILIVVKWSRRLSLMSPACWFIKQTSVVPFGIPSAGVWFIHDRPGSDSFVFNTSDKACTVVPFMEWCTSQQGIVREYFKRKWLHDWVYPKQERIQEFRQLYGLEILQLSPNLSH